MKGDGVLSSAEGASRTGLGCCTPPLASSNFRSENVSTMSRPAIDVAAVAFAERVCLAAATSEPRFVFTMSFRRCFFALYIYSL